MKTTEFPRSFSIPAGLLRTVVQLRFSYKPTLPSLTHGVHHPAALARVFTLKRICQLPFQPTRCQNWQFRYRYKQFKKYDYRYANWCTKYIGVYAVVRNTLLFSYFGTEPISITFHWKLNVPFIIQTAPFLVIESQLVHVWVHYFTFETERVLPAEDQLPSFSVTWRDFKYSGGTGIGLARGGIFFCNRIFKFQKLMGSNTIHSLYYDVVCIIVALVHWSSLGSQRKSK